MGSLKPAIVIGLSAIICTAILALGPLRYKMSNRTDERATVIILDTLTGNVVSAGLVTGPIKLGNIKNAGELPKRP